MRTLDGQLVWGWCDHHAEVTYGGQLACGSCAMSAERNRLIYAAGQVPPAGAVWVLAR